MIKRTYFMSMDFLQDGRKIGYGSLLQTRRSLVPSDPHAIVTNMREELERGRIELVKHKDFDAYSITAFSRI